RSRSVSPIPCSSQTSCMEHASCVAGRCRCQSPYTYYASQCIAGQPEVAGPLPDIPSNPMIVPAAVPSNSYTQPLPSIYAVPRAPPLSPPLPTYQPAIVPAPAVPIFSDAPVPPPLPHPQPPLRVSMNGQTYIMESLVQYPPPAPPAPPIVAPPLLHPVMGPPPCIPAPAYPCFFPPPVVLPPIIPPPPTTTTRPLRDETITPTTATSTITTTEVGWILREPCFRDSNKDTELVQEPTTTEEITTTSEEPTTTTTEEPTTTEPPPITTSVDSILITTTSTMPPITTAVLPTVITTSTTTFRPARDEPCISYPLEQCVIPGTLCVGGSRCMQGMCLCRMNEEVIDGECCAIPQPPVIPAPPPPTVYQLQPQGCQSQSCCQPGFLFHNQQCSPPPQKIRAINIVVGNRCSNTVQCDRGAYCLSGMCQCSTGYHQLNGRCISLRQLL
ncbi:hypothetical protein PENTCL1PPCAC_29877, partial [Pristionchus entomophagus]